LGGRSEIGLAVLRRLVVGGARTVVLAARRAEALDEQERSLRARAPRRCTGWSSTADDWPRTGACWTR